MTDHTPTPWRISGRKMKPSSEPYGIVLTGERSDGFQSSVAFCARHPGIDTPTAEANAAFIVKAVNNHDALVGALTELYAQVRGECPSLLNEDSGGDGTLDLEIRTLLASVETVGGSGK